MNQIFPPIQLVSTTNAKAGSLIQLPRKDRLLALVTNETTPEQARSLVILNADFRDRPSVVFADNWKNVDACLTYSQDLSFELSAEEKDVDIEHNWWRTSGVIVCANGQTYLQAASVDRLDAGMRLVNIRDGAVNDAALPHDAWFFGVWRIFLRDEFSKQTRQLFEFNVHELGKHGKL